MFADGLYHLFVAEMVLGCSLDHWAPNSAIIRATSVSPLGPFAFAETVFPAFAHNPQVVAAPEGGFLIFMIGNGLGLDKPVDCTKRSETPEADRRRVLLNSAQNLNGSAEADRRRVLLNSAQNLTGSVEADRRQVLLNSAQNLTGSGMYVSHAPSVYGPWSKPIEVEWTNNEASPLLRCSGNNPAPLVLPNGTVMLAFEGGCGSFGLGVGFETLGIASAPNWKGPYSFLTMEPILERGLCLTVAEDPFLWAHSRGYSLLTHYMCPTGLGNARLAYSEDGVRWRLALSPPYPYFMEDLAGNLQAFSRMERPQMLFDEEGTPTVLYNGVMRIGAGTNHMNTKDGTAPLGWETDARDTFTLARPLSTYKGV